MIVFVFYGGRMSPIVIRLPDQPTCERTAAAIEGKLRFRAFSFGRVEHLCVETR